VILYGIGAWSLYCKVPSEVRRWHCTVLFMCTESVLKIESADRRWSYTVLYTVGVQRSVLSDYMCGEKVVLYCIL
jgi:hypothetical protein